MESIPLKIIKTKIFVFPVAILCGIIIGIILYFISKQDKIVFPASESYTYDFYTDEATGGNSKILNQQISDSVIRFQFKLQDGFHSPYTGLTIGSLTNSFINAQGYNQISIIIKGESIERIGLAIFTPYESNKIANPHFDALYHSYLNISNQKKAYNIPIKQLKHPEWWEDLYHFPSNSKSNPDLTKIINITIGSAFSPSIEDIKTLEIHSVLFSRNNKPLFTALGAIGVAFGLFLFLVLYIKEKRKTTPSPLTVLYKPLAVEESITNTDRCFYYINNNFNHCNLSLDLVSKETGISQRHITNAIRTKFNSNFKTYVNQIRINEAKRLLSETNLNIGEIAFKVGFNNQSHFNRVFKNELQISPTEFREKQNP